MNKTMQNKKRVIKWFTLFLILTFNLAPLMAQAAKDGLQNPIGTSDPDEIIARIISAFLGLLSGLSLIIFIYGGFLMMFSGGNSELVGKAKKTITYAVIGLLIILGSYGTVKYVFETLVGTTK